MTFLKQLITDLVPLWVGGLAVLQIHVLSQKLPLEGEPYEWAQYLLLATFFPALVILVHYGTYRYPAAQALLGLACFAPVGLWAGAGWFLCLLLGMGQVLVLLVLLRLHAGPEGVGRCFPARPSGILVGLALTCLCWIIGTHWVWYHEFPLWLISSAYSRTVGLGALLLASAAVAGLCLPRAGGSPWFGWCTKVVALAVFALLGMHMSALGMRNPPGSSALGDLLGRRTFHHWGAILEPADLVRQGGHLLWDVPAQYGFLNTLIVAALPFANVWQSLYVCHALLQIVSAGIIFWLLWSLRPGLVQFCFALALTAAAVFLIPSETVQLSGPFPSIGGFRFLWCYVLLGVLAWDYDSLRRGGPGRRRTLWLGNLAWLAGTLWSAESGIYCATIWAPSYFLLVLRRTVALLPGPGCWRSRLAGLAAWLALPPLLLAAAIALIAAVYAVALGIFPDGRCFVEYCLALGFFALPINPSGPVGMLLLAFLVIATIAAYCLRDDHPLEPLPLALGAAAALWAVSSYFVGRSHDNTAINLTPLLVCSLAAALRIVDRASPNAAWPAWIKLSLMPVFTVLLAMPFVDQAVLEAYLGDTAQGYHAEITDLLPDIDPRLQELLDEAAVRADTPIAFFDNDAERPCPCPRWHAQGRSDPVVSTRAWLPAGSTVLYGPLPPVRRHVYFSRFIARARLGGWLIRPNNEPLPDLAWILDELKKTHVPGRTLSNAAWTMTWYEYAPGP